MSISNYLEDKLLDHVLRNTAYTSPTTVYLGLHDGNPGETGANEITGGSYIRKAITMGAASGGTISNSALISFTGMPECKSGGANEQLGYAGIWDAESTGNFLWGGALTVPKDVNSGDTVQVAIGELDVTLD